MKITGYQLREALKQQTLKRDAISPTFNGTLKRYPGEEKETPGEVMQEFLVTELAVTKLQVAQMRYNLAVNVSVLGEPMTLAEAIKRVGGPARAEKMWRSATSKKESSYFNEDERDPNKERSVSVLSPKETISLAQGAAKQAGAFRAAIALGNAEVVEIEDLSPALFE